MSNAKQRMLEARRWIPVSRYPYEELTLDVLDTAYFAFLHTHERPPDYLFLSKQGEEDLSAIGKALRYMCVDSPDTDDAPVPMLMYRGVHIVILPTIPDNTLYMGIVVLD